MDLTHAPDFSLLLQRLRDAERALEQQGDALVKPGVRFTELLREAQEALVSHAAQAEENAAVLEAMLASTPDALIEVDGAGRIRFANKVFLEAAGREVIGRSWLEFSPPDRHASMERELAAALDSGEPGAFEFTLVSEDGQTRWLSTRVSPVVRDDRRVGAVVVTRDITQAKLAEAQLMAADRMAAIGILAAGVAHEINNPLASLVANLELALEDVADPDSVEHFDGERCRLILQDAREGAERIRQIVRDIKLFSRSEDDRLRPVAVEPVLESTLRMAWNEIRHRARLLKHYDAVPLVQGNESRLGQVFLNLLINAAQAIPEGHALEHSIGVSITAEGGFVSVVIADTGQGIAPAAKARLFTPFFTTKTPGVGTGLGLSICKRIVANMGGDITLDSELGRGTAVRVRLPVAPAGDVAAPSSRPPPLGRSHRRAHVLVVDDDRLLGKSLVRALERHDLVAVASAGEALGLLAAGARFDLILCDLMMPDMTGKDFFAELEAAFPAHARRTVFMTAGALTAPLEAFLASVPVRHLEKPLNLRTLSALVDEYLE